ncbi:hypothetical protein HXX76_004028 [Chlamydomonas incerta]|uniref:Uncharacterized protein n=1 Tax=Chlamydomonas incerta TaxID=51695 RepID=A0A835W9C1_CHLIN|nr:hypothetical protein HXX76_004028 [Chlamydomonas incerta]|eukprot:KAG2441176.1 hypothetical protein HXX76_004028 [Chlamydomonas incerta]
MDAITRVSYYFPTHTLTIFQILANLVINDSAYCQDQERSLVIAMLVLFSIACFFASFTDTYTAFNGQKFWVIIMPFYGPLCFSLPSDEDKDRVYDWFYLKIRDYVHAVLSTTAFVLIMLFTNPVCMCIFPSGAKDGTSKFDAAIVRTVPIVVALLIGMIMVCLGPPRQMLGFQNVPETGPPSNQPMNSNPMYAGSQADYPPTIREVDEDSETGVPTNGMSKEGPLPVSKSMAASRDGVPRTSYNMQDPYRQSMAQPQRQSQRSMSHAVRGGDYGGGSGNVGPHEGGGGYSQGGGFGRSETEYRAQ